MWEKLEARVDENEREKRVPLRASFLATLRSFPIRPSEGATKKMVALEFGGGERLVWQIEGSAEHFYLHQKWQAHIESAGFPTKLFPYQQGFKDGERHSALSRDWSFGTAPCVQVKLDSASALQRLVELLVKDGNAPRLDPAVITRWIERLRSVFPGLERFDKPDPLFDTTERDYKLETSAELRTALSSAVNDQDCVDAIHKALVKSNLLPWRAYWAISPKGDANRETLWPALATLGRAALGESENHGAALETFVGAWIKAVPRASADAGRQIAEFLFLHLAPDEGTYIRHTVRQDLWLEAVGTKFPDHGTLAETYAEEHRFMWAVRRAFAERGLAPRDMIDVQSALWVVHSYRPDTPLARIDIEVAMDAYDEYRKSGEHRELFGSFGEPRDYWVRSTRERTDRVYPSKPIVGFVRRKTELNGGWGQKSDAAAQLHNSGFIVVDQTNNPLVPPEQYDHLIRDADRIRLCALNYYIEPAREERTSAVSIRAGTLAKDLHLEDRMRNVCQALGGEKFQQLASVAPPTQSGPDNSTTTTFVFKLIDDEKQSNMEETGEHRQRGALNLILYGPPGTGKTYATALEAVQVCIGADAAAGLSADRDALMAVYRRLVSEGRIEFVTFHQSMSYEEFVEGLRPTTGDSRTEGPEGPVESAGFRLTPHDGVFKRLSERARLDQGNDGTTPKLDRTARVFKVALGQRQVEEDRIRYGLDHGLIHIGWGGDIDWSDERFDDYLEVLNEWRSKRNPNASGHDGNVVVTFSFRSDMQDGDYVVVSDGRDRIQAIGRVSGDYFFVPDAPYHPHRRPVEWLWQDPSGVERSRFYPNAFRRHSVYKLNQSLVDWDALEGIVCGERAPRFNETARNFVIIIDEINRANISKVFGELITLLESDKRLGSQNEVRLRLPYSGTLFGVPPNLHVIGTMNTADRSIALLDTALRRRFHFRELMPNCDALREALSIKGLNAENLDGINLIQLLTTLNERIEYLFDREHQIGHAYFTDCLNRGDVEEVMRHKVIPLLAEYFYEDWSKVAAVLGDRATGSNSHFLEAKRLAPPGGLANDEINEEKTRWSVKSKFDFSEFAA
jgi:hypothetical protein